MPDNTDNLYKKSSEYSPHISGSKSALNKNREDEEVDLKELFYTLAAQKWTILLCILAGAILALLVAFIQTPTYEGNGTMLIEQNQQTSSLSNLIGSSGLSNFVSNSFGVGGAVNISNEQEVLESRKLFYAIAEKLLANPIMENGRMYPVLWEEWPDDSVMIEQKYVASRIRENITYELLPGTSIIKIIYKSPSPLEAAYMVDLAMETYQEVSKKQNIELASNATEFLDTEEVEIQDSLTSAEQNLEEFMDNNDIVGLEEQASQLIQQYAELQRRRYEAEAELQGVSASITEYENRLDKLRPGLSEKLANAIGPNIEKLQFKISELKTERALIYSRNPNLNPDNPAPEKVKDINSQIELLQQRITEETESLVSSSEEFIGFLGEGGSSPVITTLTEYSKELIALRVERIKLQAQIDYLTDQLREQERFLENIPENSVDLARLERNVKVQEELYLAVTKQRAQMNMSANAELGNSRPLDESVIPEKPSHPNFLLYLLIGMFTAGFLSVGFIIMNSVLTDTIKSRKAIKATGFPLLSVIPLSTSSARGWNKIDDGAAESSKLSDAFHRLASKIMGNGSGKSNVLMVTSSRGEEGKTTVAGNLAIALAEAGKEVVAVNGDFRNTGLDNFFKAEAREGLSEVLYKQAALDDALQHTTANVHVLSSGNRNSNIANLFNSSEFKRLIASLRKKYDYVIFDTPAIGEIYDAADLAASVDGVMVVASFGSTKLPELQFSLEELTELNAQISGIVLNKYNAAKATEYKVNAYKSAGKS